MNALWWWIDRWRKSTAFTDMTLEQQGAYRNLLDEATLRGGALPNDERVLAKACGDARKWPRIRARILSRFVLKTDGWHNVTLDRVIAESIRRSAKQKAYRAKSVTSRVTVENSISTASVTASVPGNNGRPPDPDLISTLPIVPPVEQSVTRRTRRHDVPGGSTCPHTPRCHSTAECVERSLTWD